jgi:hypothetical protein
MTLIVEEMDLKNKERAQIVSKIEKKIEERKGADSVKAVYYYVFSHFTILDKSTKVEEQIFLPFHISKDLTIIKEPKEILNK